MRVIESFLFCFILSLRTISKYKPPGVYIRTGKVTEGFFALRVPICGPIFGGAYFRNFTAYSFHSLINLVFSHLYWEIRLKKQISTEVLLGGRRWSSIIKPIENWLIFQHEIEIFANIFDLVHRIEGGPWEQDWHVACNLSRVQFIRCQVCKNGWPLQSADAVRLEVLKWVHEESNFLSSDSVLIWLSLVESPSVEEKQITY